MAEKVSTDTLLRRLFRTKNLNSFLRRNEAHMSPPDFQTLLRSFCDERGLVPERVILAAQIDRTYGHQIFNGTRKPSRDKVLQLAIGMGLTLEDTQRLLQSAGKSLLYPRLKRDAVLIYCLNLHYDIIQTETMLGEYGLTLLGEVV